MFESGYSSQLSEGEADLDANRAEIVLMNAIKVVNAET